MKIKIVGRWLNGKALKCDACLELERLVQLALDELGIKGISIEKCASEEEYNSYGVVLTPVLIINGVIRMSGKVPPKEMLKEFLKFEFKKEKKI
ncbi:MAG: thioredoxin family protein [Candidatus Omnitrophica bacterium]|nr:thioredoxin family protein [Candidatus Omnitrophota bacterium]